MALKQVKNKIISTQKTGKVTKAMEAVSAVKMRKSQERALDSRAYVRAALRVLGSVSSSTDIGKHPLADAKEGGVPLVVIVTSDKGLAGSVNSAVLKKASEFIKEHTNAEVLAVGRKAVEFAVREKRVCVDSFTNVSDDVTLEDVYSIAETAIRGFGSGQYSRIEVIYQNFLSTFEQEPTHRTILPLDPAEITYIMAGIRPKHGRYSEAKDDDLSTVPAYTIEPSPEEVLSALIPQLVQIFLYHALLESKASEHSARMVAMKNATDKAKELTKSLQILYNKERQAAITAEVSEITGGIEAMK